MKFWGNRVHHRPVGLGDSHIIWKNETEGMGMIAREPA